MLKQSNPIITVTTKIDLQSYCADHNLPFSTDMLQGLELKNAKGKITKRFAQSLYKLGYKLTKEQKNAIGQIINKRQASAIFYYEIDTDMLLSPGEFGDSGSCFYSSNMHHLEYMNDDGNFAVLKVYDSSEKPYGRAWIFYDGDKPVIFNAYSFGDLNLEKIGSMLSGEFGTYRNITLRSDIWINNNQAITFNAASNAASLYIDSNLGKCCDNCENHIDTDYDSYYHDDSGDLYCEECYFELFATCEECDCTVSTDDINWIDNKNICDDCINTCDICETILLPDAGTETTDHYCVCDSCLEENYTYCGSCYTYVPDEDMSNSETCNECYCDAYDQQTSERIRSTGQKPLPLQFRYYAA